MGKYSKEELIESINRLDKLVAQIKLSRQEHFIVSMDLKKLKETIDCPCNKTKLENLEKLENNE